MTTKSWGTLLAIILTGLTVGLALATRELLRFSPVPESFLLILIVLAGIALGSLVHDFARLLVAILVVTLVGGAVMMAALLFSELGDTALGLEAAFSVALSKAVRNVFFIVPLTLIGSMVGRLFHRE